MILCREGGVERDYTDFRRAAPIAIHWELLLLLEMEQEPISVIKEEPYFQSYLYMLGKLILILPSGTFSGSLHLAFLDSILASPSITYF